MKKHEVWVVDDDRAIRWVLERALSQADIHITSFEAADAAIKRLGQETPNVIISDIRMPGIDGLSLLDHVNKLHPEVPVIIMTAHADLRAFDWPGNVRQLENVCRWLTVMASAQEVHLEDLPPELRMPRPALGNEWENNLKHWVDDRLAAGESDLLNKIVPGLERVLIRAALAKTGGRRQQAAQLLGWGRNTLTRKIKELGIENA